MLLVIIPAQVIANLDLVKCIGACIKSPGPHSDPSRSMGSSRVIAASTLDRRSFRSFIVDPCL